MNTIIQSVFSDGTSNHAGKLGYRPQFDHQFWGAWPMSTYAAALTKGIVYPDTTQTTQSQLMPQIIEEHTIGIESYDTKKPGTCYNKSGTADVTTDTASVYGFS